jgi:hypothetical protein
MGNVLAVESKRFVNFEENKPIDLDEADRHGGCYFAA